ncbi:MAG: right-handed parallel beta-helix repeat-containing protein [Rikenellaceae bacterium]
MKIRLLTLALLACTFAQAKVWHVAKNGSDNNPGTKQSPVLTISKAARYALPEDTVLISSGTYRERISPANTGLSKRQMISYMAEQGADVTIKGSEQITSWEQQKDGTWRAEIDNKIFGDYNPFSIKLYGDWVIKGHDFALGEVYINNLALKQELKLDAISNTELSWYSEVNDNSTIIYANFDKLDPNKELAEINVRETCFFPKTTGINYIKVKGIKISQAATQWAPPTGEQMGAIGPNWSKGWIIEDCEVSHSKCVGISLGKERASGQNRFSNQQRVYAFTKAGFSYEIEAIIKADNIGWDKDFVGSHQILNNKIHSCGQAGIVGHLGGAFSTIMGNEIINVNTDRRISGHEIAGIKLHAAIDVVLKDNIIINCYRGLWLDWQAQGTQVVGNIMAQNSFDDLFIEVSHGPTLVYNNILLSNVSLSMNSQGVAIFNNLLNGTVKVGSSVVRYTPYHMPHSTKLKGFFNNCGGDVRFYNNIFTPSSAKSKGKKGLEGYNNYPVYSEDMGKSLKRDTDVLSFKLPVWTSGNVYYSGVPYDKEVNYTQYNGDEKQLTLTKKGNSYYIDYEINAKQLAKAKTVSVNTQMLGKVILPEAYFENPDGSDFILEYDIFGDKRAHKPTAGPFESLIKGRAVWTKQK